jgi:hypothetical protein
VRAWADLVIFDCHDVSVDSELIFGRVLAECLVAVDFRTTVDEAVILGFTREPGYTLGRRRSSIWQSSAEHIFAAVPTNVRDPAAIATVRPAAAGLH